jgi:hypothetical protein
MTDLNDPDEGVDAHPDYNPLTWALGYQVRQFGVAADPTPSGLQANNRHYPSSVYSAMANPPADMTTAIEMALPAAPVITPDQ